MRKILSGFLATAMVASVCTTVSFAKVGSRVNEYTVNLAGSRTETSAENPTAVTTAAAFTLVLTDAAGGTLTFVSDSVWLDAGADEIASAFAGKTSATGGSAAYANGTAIPAAAFTISNNGDGTITITNANAGSNYRWDPKSITFGSTPAASSTVTDDANVGVISATARLTNKVLALDATTNTADVDTSSNLDPNDVLVCDDYGNPIALVKDGAGTEKQINDDGGVQSDNKVYFMIQDNGYNPSVAANVPYGDDKYYKIKVNKGDNAKQVKAITVVEKNVSSNNLYDVVNGGQIRGTSGRHRFIQVELNPNYTTDEFKLTFDVRVTPTTSAVDRGYALDGDELKIRDFSVWMKNIERDADNDWKVGINGLMLKPLSNDWNDVTWFDEDGDLAHMKFFADSDVDSFYSKLSTKWPHADYAAYFNDQDAFLFDFTGSPKLSATSRADLEIYNPFVDEDGNETIDPSSAVIYQIIDGDLFNVTDNFTYEEVESGDMAFKTRTRFLGTYIICEKEVEEAVDSDVPDTDLVPEDTTPVEVTPGNNDGGKAPANTGKYL